MDIRDRIQLRLWVRSVGIRKTRVRWLKAIHYNQLAGDMGRHFHWNTRRR